ncbi:long-chain-fatty-acid--CoA ligase [Salinibacillus xinjiangensis]|uniref:AMP-binding protein n=1 Tax=Salinibacillus xinjiangensis TaxID=1229268 RepID=A0A6G1X991_9BACI|nr:long-chain fatty acid--CoA ligase [Salinibacillus xinjiangensis]MRG87573.1 AMP-binding protein [Salinibacillus xinjiangensis]
MVDKRWLLSYPEGVEATTHIEIPELTIVDFLENSIKERPNHPALVFENESYTYQELGSIVRKIANGLQKRGVKKGSSVGLMMNNCPELIFSYYAILFSGGIVVQNNPMYKERELSYHLQDSGAEFLIVEHNILETLPTIYEKVENIIVTRVDEHPDYDTVAGYIQNESDNLSPETLNPKEDIAVLQYTGGTTGVSKGVKLTHYNLVSNVVQVEKFMGVHCRKGEEKVLNVLPLFHVYGMTVSMNYCFYLQSTLYLVERFESTKILSIIHDENITMFPGTPTIYVAVNSDDNIARYDLSSIHTCISGSAPLSVEVKNQFESITGAKLVDAYGLSEASPVTHSNPVNGVQKPGSMGLPISGTDCRIVDIHDGETEMDVNQPGELIVKGPQVMQGYWNREEETHMSLRNGWLYTGDIAYMDEEGYCFIVSRKKDVIIASGYNIYPREIEEVLYEHPSVQEVVVCGVPDSYRGETVKAFVVKKDGQEATGDELKNFCREKLAKFKVPAYIEFRKELPKSTVGKILRRKLIEEEQEESNSVN